MYTQRYIDRAEIRRLLHMDHLRLHGADWRWKLACQLSDNRETKGYKPQSADAVTELAHAALTGNSSPIGSQASGYRVSEVLAARKVHETSLQRLLITGRILAKQGVPDIAANIGISRRIVELYKLLFLDIDNHLEEKNLIFDLVIEPSRDFDATRSVIWKHCYLTTEVANEILSHVPFLGQTHDLNTLEGRTRERLELMIAYENLLRSGDESVRTAWGACDAVLHNCVAVAPTVADLLFAQVSQTITERLKPKDPADRFKLIKQTAHHQRALAG